jgi:hypothetical protein
MSDETTVLVSDDVTIVAEEQAGMCRLKVDMSQLGYENGIPMTPEEMVAFAAKLINFAKPHLSCESNFLLRFTKMTEAAEYFEEMSDG